MDYAGLRAQALESTQDEEAVTVNTRALIDKVLARYSGEWTTLRELIQNAADASASKVKIKFETLPSATVPTPQSTDSAERLKHIVLHHTIQRLVVSNDGQPFNSNDWSRLKRIAEGNPDETKIGAFGVGFYSVFADCENPFVVSGKESMAFYWKNNSLFTRKGTISSEQAGAGDTCFVLDYRNTTSTVPNLMSICQFLSTSLTFIGLESIELWLDEWKLFSLTKKSSPSEAVIVPRDLEKRTKEGMMSISKVDRQNSQIDAQWTNIVGWTPVTAAQSTPSEPDFRNAAAPSLRSFFSRLTGSSQNNAAAKRAAKEEQEAQKAIAEDLAGQSQATVFIRVNTAHIKSQVTSNFASELERATKKPPPKTTKIAILTSSYDETAASLSTLSGTASKKAAEIITSVLPSKSGRIFIGFPTAQTSGLLAHISAPSLIPTVERESIDLNARYVRTWNTELLTIAGIACRIAYHGEMATLRDRLLAMSKTREGASNANSEDSPITKLLPAAIHTLQQYTFKESTPLVRAGQIIEESFWTCNKNASIEMFSSRGVLPSHEVRIASEDLSFVSGIPVIQDEILKEAEEFVNKLQDLGLVLSITTDDIKKELERQALTEAQLLEFLKWSATKAKRGNLEVKEIQSLFAVTIVTIEGSKDTSANSKLLMLGDVKTFINISRIPPDLPVPPHTIPFRYTRSLNQGDMQAFGWGELQTVLWLRWLLDAAKNGSLAQENDLTASPVFAEQVLPVLSRSWDGLSQSSKATVVELLAVRTVIPTKLGMRKPPDSYFASVKLFDDLPTITSLNSVKEKFLKALGVRKTIELSVIFQRLMAKSTGDDKAAGSGWSHVDLVRYLANVWSDIPAEDIAQLQGTALCPAEKEGDSSKPTSRHYKVSELFEPKESLRSIGLPVLQWPGQWNGYSAEGKFLKSLGLRSYPSVPELVEKMVNAHAQQDRGLYGRVLQYLIQNHYNHNYASFDLSNVKAPFLPMEGDDKTLAAPSECFTNSRAALLGYNILRSDLHSHAAKFGVRTDPDIGNCAGRLIAQPPKSRSDARHLFGYFAGRLAEISPTIAERLGSSTIVPIPTSHDDQGKGASAKIRMAMPNSCFLGDGQEYGDIFDYVDFGQEPNAFLLKVGSKHEPSVMEVAHLLIREPTRIFQVLGIEKYQSLLRKLHASLSTLKRDKVLWKEMKKSPFLLAYKETPSKPQRHKNPTDSVVQLDTNLDEDEDAWVKEYRLKKAESIIIVDDVVWYNQFREHVAAAPQEETLEDLYYALGTPMLSSLVDEQPRLGPRSSDQNIASRLRELIIERSQLFLHDQPSGSVVHDVKWLERNLLVQKVESVSLNVSLRGQKVSLTTEVSAFLTQDPRAKAMLSITKSFDVWQVSQAIVHCIIDRPKPQTVMLYETFLTTPLLKLRSRGYNVDRILRRQKAAEEARIAETERQRREEDERRRRDEEQRRSEQESNKQTEEWQPAPSITNGEASSHSPKIKMPGGFGDSPEHPPQKSAMQGLRQQQQQQPPKGFFSSISKQLGFNDTPSGGRGLQTAANSGGNPFNPQGSDSTSPPPYSPFDPQQPKGPGQVEKVTAPDRVQQNLQSAIKASRAYGSSSLFSMPQTNQVKEVASYCDTQHGQNISFLGTSSPGVRTFISNTAANKESFMAQNASGLDSFAAVLLLCGSVFGVSKDTLHIYFDEVGSTIAFNRSGSLFFNYRFFAQLHLAGMQTAQYQGQAIVYWWVVMCHELAHNLVGDHSSDHSYYCEQFVAQYFPVVAGKISQVLSPPVVEGVD